MSTLSPTELEGLLAQARRNEEIQKRLDAVDDYLLGHHRLPDLLGPLCAQVGRVFGLEAVTLALVVDNRRLKKLVESSQDGPPQPPCFFRPRRQLRAILLDLETPFLSNRPEADLLECLFPEEEQTLHSVAVLPLWARGEFLGAMSLGSTTRERYRPGLDTHFVQVLANKTARGLDSALVFEEKSGFERREAVMQMAGAACHELAQPLTNASIKVDLLLDTVSPEDPQWEHLEELRAEMDRLGGLIRRISRVSEYVTKPYVGGISIIDLEAASAGEAQAAGEESE